MGEAYAAGSHSVRLHRISEELMRAYRGLCRHTEDSCATHCPSCEQIDEVQDMIRCSAGSTFEALALCAHFQQELRALASEPGYHIAPGPPGGALGMQSA